MVLPKIKNDRNEILKNEFQKPYFLEIIKNLKKEKKQ
jgi:uracil DNA glycosylase